MEPDKPFSDSPNQTALQQAELAALIRMLNISEGTFSLSLAICNSPALREYLIAKIKEEKADIEIIPIEKDTTRVLTFIEKKINNKKPSAIFVTEIEKNIPSDDTQPKVIRTLNASRELWQEKFSCPVVFWLPEYAATMLKKDAPDFSSWISHTFEFVSEQATATFGMLDTYAGDIISAGRLDADQKRFRIAELEQRIGDAGDPPESRLVRHVLTWLDELTYIYMAIGELDKALENNSKSLRIAEKFDLQASIASAYGNLGLIYLTRGDLTKAEEILKKSLVINEKLGRLEGIARDYANLGIICEQHGDVNKARELWEKAHTLFKKAGMKPDIEKTQRLINELGEKQKK